MALMFPTVMLVVNVSSVAVLWFGAHRIDSGGMQIGALTAFLSYLMQILMSVMMATFMFMMVPRAEVCAERIQEVLDTESSVVPPAEPGHRSCAGTAQLELRGVDFRYPGAEEPVLRGVDLVARPGETTAIIGSTGSGKTTLLNLVPRLFDATGGAVLVDGVDVRDLDPALLAGDGRAGAAEAVPVLRHRRLQPALRQARRDRRGAVARAGGRPGRATSSRQMPDGLDAPIAQGGTNVSGGQRQRLAIARALVRRPEIYLFDDSFSALDYATDAALRAALAARDRRRDGGHRRPAGQHHPRRRPHRRARRGPGGRHRHPHRADGGNADLPGDRAVPAHRAGGRHEHRTRAPRRTRRPGPPASVPARCMAGAAGREVAGLQGLQPAAAAACCGPSARCSCAVLGARRRQRRAVGARPEASSATPPTSSSPASSAASCPPGVTKAAGRRRGCARRATARCADMLAAMDVVPGQGIDFTARRPACCCWALGVYVAASAVRRWSRAG